MSESFVLALVAAGSGLVGTVVGGLSSLASTYFVPKWERDRISEADFIERRRLAIIQWTRAGQLLAPAAIRQRDDRKELSAAFNLAISELTSLLKDDEDSVDNFVHGASSYSGGFKHNEGARSMIVATTARMLLSWHRGSSSKSELKPFKLVKASGGNGTKVVYVPTWSTKIDREIADS